MIVLMAIAFAGFCSARSYGLEPCNGLRPKVGNCGTEVECKGTTKDACLAITGTYYATAGGIGTESSGSPDTYAAVTDFVDLDCTCAFQCKWTAKYSRCSKGAATGFCASQKEVVADNCTAGG